jgi:hypothetical protein
MIKGIIRLENDITGRAGQLLVLREDNSVHVVTPEALEAIFLPAVEISLETFTEIEPVAEPKKRKKHERTPRAFGYYDTAEALEAARARGRHMAAVRARRRAERLAAE